MNLETGRKAPDWRLASVGGTSTAFHDFLGRPALYVGWASWHPSRALLPGLEALQRKVGDRLHVVSIAFDGLGVGNVMKFVPQGFVHDVLIDACFLLSRAWGVKDLPFAVLVDGEGHVQLSGEPGPKFWTKVEGALKKKPARKKGAAPKPPRDTKSEFLIQSCANFMTRERRDEAVGFLREAEALDRSNRIIARQRLAVSNPEKFYGDAIDESWVAQQLTAD